MYVALVLFVGAFFCLLIYVLFAPIIVQADTRIKLYRIMLFPVFCMQWVPDCSFGYPEMTLFGFRKIINSSTTVIGKKTTGEKTKQQPYFKLNFKMFVALLDSFTVKNWLVNIDSGDMALNGQLFPVMYGIQQISGKKCAVNFRGINEVIITIQNNVFSILKALIK